MFPPTHILIVGGDSKYLPLAKSKLQAMADRVGPSGYGSEKLVIEGTTIHIQMVAGVRRITIGGAGDLFMDSGSVDINTVSLADPTLGQTDGTVHYNTTIEAVAATDQLLGTIRPPAITCSPTEDASVTKAFKAKVSDGARVAESEALLAVKKTCSKLAPPSQFTGKMRLFVQAKYGAQLDAWQFTINLDNQPPSLDATFSEAAFQFHPGLCGIYTDTLKRHWLVQIGLDGAVAYEGVTIFRMQATDNAEKLRPLLLQADRSEAEKERIEAYILSASRPRPATKVQFPMTIPARTSMGYGWHFSWSGASADIVSHDSGVFGSGLEYYATHYRLSISATAEGAWSAEISAQETATWGNNKWKTVIAHPDWTESKLTIFGSTLGRKLATNAPVYCFWRRDGGEELFEIIRYSYDPGISAIRGAFVSDPPYYWGMKAEAPGLPSSPGCANQGLSMGLEATRYDSITYPATSVTSSFSSTTESVSLSSRSQSSTGLIGTEKSSSRAGLLGSSGGYPEQPIQDGPGGMPVFDTTSYCPTGTYGAAHGPTTGMTPVGGTLSQYYSRVTWTQYAFTESVTEDFASLLVIPFGDAEAVYVHGKEYRLVETTRTTSRVMDSTVNDLDYIEYYNINNGSVSFDWYDTGAGLDSDHDVAAPVADGTVITTPEDERWTIIASKLISNAGVQDTAWSPSNAFFAGDPTETVDEQLFTLSSTGGDVKGEEIDLTGGYDAGINTAPFVFVGWA